MLKHKTAVISILITIVLAFFVIRGFNKENAESPIPLKTDTIYISDLSDIRKNIKNSLDEIAKNIASPVEIVNSIKSKDYAYNSDYLLRCKLSKFVGANEKAIALGGIGVDLMYVNYFEKMAEIPVPLLQVRRLSNDLYLSQFFDFELLKDLTSQNISADKFDSIIFFTTYNINKMESHLLTSDRIELGAYMTLGAWTEGVYFLTRYATQYQDEDIIEKVAEQQFFLKELMALFNLAGITIPEEMNDNLLPVKDLFEEISFTYENTGDPWKTVDMSGNEVWYQFQISHAQIDSLQLAKITAKISDFRDFIFKR